MRNVCRVLLRDVSTLRSFYWFEVASDHSIYFGSSNSQWFRTGRGGTATAEIDGTWIDPLLAGRAKNSEEIKGKHSIHGSGIVNLPMRAEGLHQRYQIAPPRDAFSNLPLLAILPMQPARYPVSAKTPKPTDIVLDAKCYSPHPLGLLFYLNNTDQLEPAPVVAAKPAYETFTTESIRLGEFRLCVSVYSQPSLFKSWQQMEVTVLGHPNSRAEEPNWPFFG